MKCVFQLLVYASVKSDLQATQNLLMPHPGTDNVGKCRAVAQGGGWAQLDWIAALHNDDLRIGMFVLKRESNVTLHGH